MEDTLIDAALVPDSDADNEMGGDVAAIADEELRGCRLLITRRAVESVGLLGVRGGILKLGCSFQPTHGTRFVWARVIITVSDPKETVFVDVAPAVKLDERPVKFVVSQAGKLKAEYAAAGLEAGRSSKTSAEFDIYYCAVHGTGAGTAKARWELEENPRRQDGLERELALWMTLGQTGRYRGNVSIYAKLVRQGVAGTLDAARYMMLGPDEHHTTLAFEIPNTAVLEVAPQ